MSYFWKRSINWFYFGHCHIVVLVHG